MIRIPGIIPITIHPFFWLLAAMIGYLQSQSILGTFIWAAVILVSVLFHEFGHALTALAFRQRSAITLFGMGGVTERVNQEPLKSWQEFLVVLNGPLFGFGLFFLSVYLFDLIKATPGMTVLKIALSISMSVNFIWTVLNLFPVYPLDGGKLLAIALSRFFGSKGMRASLLISTIIGGLTSIYFFIQGQLFAGAIFMMFGFESWRAFSAYSKEEDPMQGPLKQRSLKENGDYAKALKVGSNLFRENPSFELAMENARLAAKVHDVRSAMGWIARSKEISNIPIERLVVHKDFDSIRDEPEFKEFVDRNSKS